MASALAHLLPFAAQIGISLLSPGLSGAGRGFQEGDCESLGLPLCHWQPGGDREATPGRVSTDGLCTHSPVQVTVLHG